jgi:hypothetical protein
MKPSRLLFRSSCGGAAGCPSGIPIPPSKTQDFIDIELPEDELEEYSPSSASATEYNSANGTSK